MSRRQSRELLWDPATVARVGGVELGHSVNTMQMRMTRLYILSSDSYCIPKAAVQGLG